MSEVWLLAALWVGPALVAVLLAIKLRTSTAFSEREVSRDYVARLEGV
jgi:hypothetical protein